VCWNRRRFTFGLYAQDVVEDVFYRDKIVRASDRAEWILFFSGSTNSIRARIGAGIEPIVDEPSVRLVNNSGLNGDFRNIAAMELPAKLFGKDRFKRGDTIDLASTPSFTIAGVIASSGRPFHLAGRTMNKAPIC